MGLTKRVNKGNESNWRSFSDIMTGLMVIFMFIAISYINEVQKKQQQRDIIFEEFKATKEELFQNLKIVLKMILMNGVELDKDLSIKFTNPEVLFESGQQVLAIFFNNT